MLVEDLLIILLKTLFYISKCTCNILISECKCGKIPRSLRRFILDQQTERRHKLSEFVLPETESTIITSIPTIPSASDETYQPESSEMISVDDNIDLSTSESERTSYAPRYNVPTFAMECDRFGVHDRVAASLASALFKDIGIKDKQGRVVVMDKNKFRRERNKIRLETLRRQYDDTSLKAFSFDGRKDDSITREKIDEKWHPRMVLP